MNPSLPASLYAELAGISLSDPARHLLAALLRSGANLSLGEATSPTCDRAVDAYRMQIIARILDPDPEAPRPKIHAECRVTFPLPDSLILTQCVLDCRHTGQHWSPWSFLPTPAGARNLVQNADGTFHPHYDQETSR